jgi:diaminopropionate ammonia-lyase
MSDFPIHNMASEVRRSIYSNPSARSWTAPASSDHSSQIRQFYSSLPDFAPTPLIPLDDLAQELGIKKVFVKAETSRLGLPSFKLLGASWAVRQAIIHRGGLPLTASLDDLRAAAKDHDVRLVAATDGNHGRAVARMGNILGIKGTKIFVPKSLDETAKHAIASEGAEIIEVDGDYDESVRKAHKWSEKTPGGMLIEGTAFEGYKDVPKVRCFTSYYGVWSIKCCQGFKTSKSNC